MRKIVNILTLLFLVLTMSCTKENLQGAGSVPVGDEVELRFGTFDTRATADEEKAVNRVRILIFGSLESQDRGKLLCNKLAIPDAEGNIKPVIITTGVRNIYLIVNEPQNTDGSELDAYKTIAQEEDIEALELAYIGTSATPPYSPTDIPMFVKHIGRKVFPNSKNETNSEVERVMAKVTLNLNIKNANFSAGKQPVIKNITIKNLPNKSYYIAKPYIGDLVDSEIQTPGTAETPITDYDYSCSNTFYIPEYILSSLDKNAYLEIKGTINGDATGKVLTWFVKLGDAMVLDNPTANDRYDITRNRHYIMTGDVKTYGQFEELDVEVTVLPWNSVAGGVVLGDMIQFSKITTTVDTKLVPLVDGGYVDIRGETISVHCKTNVGGWYALTYNGATRVHTSDTTDVISSIEVQPVTVVIPTSTEVLPPTTDISVEYTIKLYHPTIAPESAGPFKTLTIKQDGGVIPNSTLVKSFIIQDFSDRPPNLEITYDGWPINKLPPRGIQLAKRDNKLPSEPAGIEDWSLAFMTPINIDEWCPIDECQGIGYGESNTNALIAKEAELRCQYPIARKCKSLGEGWYLPSMQELSLIFCNAAMGASYNFRRGNEGFYAVSSGARGPSSPIIFINMLCFYGNGYNPDRIVLGSGSTYSKRPFRCIKNL